MYLSSIRAHLIYNIHLVKQREDNSLQRSNVTIIARLQSLILDFLIKLGKNHISKQQYSPRNRVFIFPALLRPPLMATHCMSAQRTYALEKLCQGEGSWIVVARRVELGFPRYFSYALPYFQKCSYFFQI